MSAPARITQADMDRATKAIANARIERARIVMDLKNARIEIIVGESGGIAQPERNTFDED